MRVGRIAVIVAGLALGCAACGDDDLRSRVERADELTDDGWFADWMVDVCSVYDTLLAADGGEEAALQLGIVPEGMSIERFVTEGSLRSTSPLVGLTADTGRLPPYRAPFLICREHQADADRLFAGAPVD